MTAPVSWLADDAEVALGPRPAPDHPGFVDRCVLELRVLGVPLWQAFELTAVACLEASWGESRAVEWHNLGGVKAKRMLAGLYVREHGRPQRWFRAPGHTASGDPAEVYYLAWDSDADFWRMWLARHVGARPGAEPWEPRYVRAGALFWGRFGEWIEALITAGYRGDVTAAHPTSSVEAHHAIVRRATALWAQSRLGVRTDGEWGPRSRAALCVVQHAHGLPETGELDDAALALLETR